MTKINSDIKVALVTESLWGMGGANRVLDSIAEIYPQADIFALFGDPNEISKSLRKHNIYFSKLNRRAFVKKLYRYTYHLWPLHIEQFDFSNYDLVISSSASVAFGVITPLNCKHIAYIHSPMRYLWDLKNLDNSKFKNLKQRIVDFFLVFLRVWEVSASDRPDIVIANSKFVSKRISKYWGRTSQYILTPPVQYFEGKIPLKREKYVVAGAPFEFNKKGDFLMKCLNDSGIKLKVIGWGSMAWRLKEKYKNIEFLGKISESEKWNVLSKASCFVVPGIEDYGIFPIEAMSAGTPVLAFNNGGVVENIKEGINGYCFNNWDRDEFLEKLDMVLDTKWDHEKIARIAREVSNSKDMFKEKFEGIVKSIS